MIKVITLWQPWATLFVNGVKKNEELILKPNNLFDFQ